MRTSFHHQPEAQHPIFQLSTSWQADYPIFRGNLARKTKGWLEHEIHHAAENSRGIIEVPAARVDAAGQSPRLRRAGALTWPDKARTRTASGRKERQLQSFGDHVLIRC